MLNKWVLSLVCGLAVLVCLTGCGKKKAELPTAETVQQKAEEGKPLSRRERARLEDKQQTAPAGEAPATGR